MTVLSKSKDGKTLYAVAFLKWTRQGWVNGLEHLHADDVGHARAQFCCANPNRRTHRIIDVAPAIGFFAEDDNGDILSC